MIFSRHAIFEMGDGSKIIFWYDVWCMVWGEGP
jgi:hypothetical protein